MMYIGVYHYDICILQLISTVYSTAETTLYFRDDDEFLIRFLRPTKFYPESALQLVRKYMELR
jgi:hypothetical protein